MMAGFHIEFHILWWADKCEEDDMGVKECNKRVLKIASHGWNREGAQRIQRKGLQQEKFEKHQNKYVVQNDAQCQVF